MASKDYRFTIGYTYYEDPELLQEQINLWKYYPPGIEIIVVDDGSSIFPAEDLLKDIKIQPHIKLYEVDEDLGFNSHGCRNLIASVASSEFILFCDIDCQFPPSDIANLKTKKFNSNSTYRFGSYSISSYRHSKQGHVNVFVVNKEKFWEAGGYDESFTGWHYGDREFLDRLEKITDNRILSMSCTIVRGKRETIIDEDIVKTEYNNYSNTLKTPIKEKTYAEMRGTVETKINFSYTQVL
jgi:glycosyltransferase involved in cell wall biosynthesis